MASDSGSSARADWVHPVTLLLLTLALAVSTAMGGWASGSPLLWYGLIVYLSLRHRRRAWVSTLFVPATLLFVLWFAEAAAGVFIPFLVGLVVAYLLDPLIDRLERRMGRGRAIAVLAGPVLVGGLVLALLIIPSLVSELLRLLGRLPELAPVLQRAFAWASHRAAGLGIQLEATSLNDFLLPRLEQLGSAVGGAGLTVLRGVQGLISLISFLVITPVVSFYLLRDIDRMREGLLTTVPAARRAGVESFLAKVDLSVSGYVRGQLLVGVVVGVLFIIGLSILGVDYAVLVGLSAIVLNLIPYVGSVLTALLALSVALLSEPTWGSVLAVGLLYGGIQLIDAAVLSPRIMGQSLDLHPVAVMIALLIGGQFFGLAGVILAVPTIAVLKEAVVRWTPTVLELFPTVYDEEQE